MIKISIVPDTNILISSLEIVKGLYSCSFNAQYTVNFSKTVLNELDGLKKKSVHARNAIKFIESVTDLLKTEIEGKIDERKMDVVVNVRELITTQNNDDKILNYCFQLENPVFLTNDKAFILKCDSHNIKSVKVEDKKLSAIVKEIHKLFGLNTADKQNEAKKAFIEHLKQSVKATIEPCFIDILSKELGNNFEIMLKEDTTLEFYCNLVVKNFFLFKNFLPQKSPKIIKEFVDSLKTKDLPRIKHLAGVVCHLFRKTLPEDAF